MPRISTNTSQRKEPLRFGSNELEFYTVRVETEIHGQLGRLCLFGWQAHQIGQNLSIVATCSLFVTRNWSHKLHNWSVLHRSKTWYLLPLFCIALKWHRWATRVAVPWCLARDESYKISQPFYLWRLYKIRQRDIQRRMLILRHKSHKKHLFSVTYWLLTPWRWHDSVETCRSVIIERLLVLVPNEKKTIRNTYVGSYVYSIDVSVVMLQSEKNIFVMSSSRR